MAPQPPGAIKDGCRTASPSATWRTDPDTRQVPAPHRRPCHMATTPRRDQDAVGEANLDGSSRHIIITGQDVPQMMAVTPAGP